MKDLSKIIITALLTLVISMSTFWLVQSRQYITRTEVVEIVNIKEAIIIKSLADQYTKDNELHSYIRANSEAIRELQVQVGQLVVLFKGIKNYPNE